MREIARNRKSAWYCKKSEAEGYILSSNEETPQKNEPFINIHCT